MKGEGRERANLAVAVQAGHIQKAVMKRTCILAIAVALAGCERTRKADPVEGAGQGTPPAAAPKQPSPGPGPDHVQAQAPAAPAPGPAEPPPERRVVLLAEGGAERVVDVAEAEAAGYTVVDLSEGWTPYIFQQLNDEQGAPRPQRYRRIFLGLASDTLDADGQPLEPEEKNYLELFGIPPSLSVVRARFLRDEGQAACEAGVDLALLAAAKPVRMEDGRRPFAKATAAVLKEVEKRLACEGLFPQKPRHQPGVHDEALREAVRRFQHKHMIYDTPYLLRARTLQALSRPMQQNNHLTLRRVMTERVVSAARVIEDGTAGEKDGVRNLVQEYTDAALAQWGLTDPAASLAFLKRRQPVDLAWLRVGVKLPPRPAYHSAHMDLSVVVDRGDVWYDLPFDDQGKPRPQPREHYPSFTLLAHIDGKRVPLVRWRTTIGGWRSEQAADGFEYYRYKGSDVGPRVIRHVAAGPVWIAPESTPIRTLVKGRKVNGAWQSGVNYDEIGPGFRSAYGLVAGYFVEPGPDGKDHDNGIRAHGSAEYLSIGSSEAYSHGCHRLHNHLAVRLYSFLLTHRNTKVLGEQPLGYSRQFLYKDEVYELRLPSRGYHFELVPPLPVEVLQGNIKGERKQPFTEYVPKPGVVYSGPPPRPGKAAEDRAGGE